VADIAAEVLELEETAASLPPAIAVTDATANVESSARLSPGDDEGIALTTAASPVAEGSAFPFWANWPILTELVGAM